MGWSGNNYTELLYSLDIVNTDVVNGDTLRFRVLRNAPSGVLADGYDETNQNVAVSFGYTGGPTLHGQTFLGDGFKLTRVGFRMAKAGTAAGPITAQLYAHTGTFGTDGFGTGSALATSSSVQASTLSVDPTYTWTYFDFDATFTLSAGTPYVIVAAASGLGADTSNTARMGVDSTSSTHPGNRTFYSGSWSFSGTQDTIFRVYTTGVTHTQVPTLNVVKRGGRRQAEVLQRQHVRREATQGLERLDLVEKPSRSTTARRGCWYDLTDARLTEGGGMRGLEAGADRVTEDYSAGAFTDDPTSNPRLHLLARCQQHRVVHVLVGDDDRHWYSLEGSNRDFEVTAGTPGPLGHGQRPACGRHGRRHAPQLGLDRCAVDPGDDGRSHGLDAHRQLEHVWSVAVRRRSSGSAHRQHRLRHGPRVLRGSTMAACPTHDDAGLHRHLDRSDFSEAGRRRTGRHVRCRQHAAHAATGRRWQSPVDDLRVGGLRPGAHDRRVGCARRLPHGQVAGP